MSEQLALLPNRLTAHVQLTLLALFFSTAFSLPVGIMITRVRWLQQPVLGIAGVIQTIPSLALLAILVVLLQSFGFLPAIIALTAYGVLPVLVNTVTGITGVDAALKEAARGVGMTPLQQLRRVELPLAMPRHRRGYPHLHGADRWDRHAVHAGWSNQPRKLHLRGTPDPKQRGRPGGMCRGGTSCAVARWPGSRTRGEHPQPPAPGCDDLADAARRLVWVHGSDARLGVSLDRRRADYHRLQNVHGAVHSERGDRETDRGGNRLSDPGHTVAGVYRTPSTHSDPATSTCTSTTRVRSGRP